MAPERAPLATLPCSKWGLGLERPLLIAGPCSAESPEQVLGTAQGIVRSCPNVNVLRAGVWKPRTRPGTFEGAGAVALEWLAEAREATGLKVATEVATPEHVEASLKAGVDILWIGARTTPNPFSVQAIADSLRGVDIPVLVKNPINPDLELWIGALERLFHAGINKLAAVHRGFSWSGPTPYRNQPMWEFPIRLKASYPELEVLCDPSHIAGSTELIGRVCQQALDLNFSGLMIETHCDPPNAWSDRDQQVLPEHLQRIVEGLVFPAASPSGLVRDVLEELRDLIDQLDGDIMQKLATRMDIVERIGEYKRDHRVAILQPERWEAIMEAQYKLGTGLGAGKDFIEAFMNAIHQESIRRQTAVRNGMPVPPEGSRSDRQE
ncbi:MAG: bifunctional 3-deoxy-7-phosphoheptulonate synthase/chorismate mutase type II [Flavobacteriales bacterium]|nr:bifunctional 3-deoxy-7-phosphoheptulonate synthase/chorismate mutase type II [Flavobacteriales bacterium]